MPVGALVLERSQERAAHPANQALAVGPTMVMPWLRYNDDLTSALRWPAKRHATSNYFVTSLFRDNGGNKRYVLRLCWLALS